MCFKIQRFQPLAQVIAWKTTPSRDLVETIYLTIFLPLCETHYNKSQNWNGSFQYNVAGYIVNTYTSRGIWLIEALKKLSINQRSSICGIRKATNLSEGTQHIAFQALVMSVSRKMITMPN